MSRQRAFLVRVVATVTVLFAGSIASAQVTLNDPYYVGPGNQISVITGNAAMAAAGRHMVGAGGERTAAQSAARTRDLAWAKDCRESARMKPVGPTRRAAYRTCEREFNQRREYWK